MSYAVVQSLFLRGPILGLVICCQQLHTVGHALEQRRIMQQERIHSWPSHLHTAHRTPPDSKILVPQSAVRLSAVSRLQAEALMAVLSLQSEASSQHREDWLSKEQEQPGNPSASFPAQLTLYGKTMTKKVDNRTTPSSFSFSLPLLTSKKRVW